MRASSCRAALLAAALSATACGGAEVDEGEAQDELAGCANATNAEGHWEFLDDACKRKAVPSSLDRAWSCPNVAGSAGAYRPSSAAIAVDQAALKGVVPDALHVTLILIKRVGGVPHYRYLSNGTAAVAYQPWSSSKFMAVANAAATLRAKSANAVGLTATVKGIPLGDLITNVHDYSTAHGFTSNGLGRWFHDVGGRSKANALIHGWLNRPAAETFGGNYGEPAPALGYTLVDGRTLIVEPDASKGPANHLSSLAMAEFLKRLALHREDARTRLPGIQWADLEVLFYGAKASKLFAGKPGGMLADKAVYFQSAVDLAAVERESHGKWRIFSKLGDGDGHFVENGYACFPVLDAAGRAVPDAGHEFVLSVRLASGGATLAARDRLLASSIKAIVTRVRDGRLK